MSKENSVSSGSSPSVLSELLHAGLYKPTQGKIVRQATFAALVGLLAIACYELSVWLGTTWEVARYPLPGVLALAGTWVIYRLVNLPKFADFLIAVQAEMNKMSWPSQQELVRSSIVVIFVIFLLAVILFGLDLFWMALFKAIGVLKH